MRCSLPGWLVSVHNKSEHLCNYVLSVGVLQKSVGGAQCSARFSVFLTRSAQCVCTIWTDSITHHFSATMEHNS